MDAAKCRNAADIIRTLGTARGTTEAWVANARDGKPVDIKRAVALAMTAAAHGLPPWPDEGNAK